MYAALRIFLIIYKEMCHFMLINFVIAIFVKKVEHFINVFLSQHFSTIVTSCNKFVEIYQSISIKVNCVKILLPVFLRCKRINFFGYTIMKLFWSQYSITIFIQIFEHLCQLLQLLLRRQDSRHQTHNTSLEDISPLEAK